MSKQNEKETENQNQNQKEKDLNETIDHNQIEEESKYSIPSEAIIKILIDKIISLSIRKSKSNEIETRMGEYCFDFIKDQIRPILSQKYIFHSEQNENELYFSNYLNDKNTWIEIEEPNLGKEDRCISTMIKMNIPFEKNIEENKELNESKNVINEKKDSNLNSNDIKKVERKSTLRNTFDLNKENINTNNNQNTNKNDINDKKKKNIILPIESFDIPNVNEDYFRDEKDVENIRDLRREMNEFIIRREKEIKQKILEEKLKEKEEKEKDQKKKEKNFDFTKFTFDSEGTILKFKPLKTDHLAKEFTLLKNNIKNLNYQKLELPKKKEKPNFLEIKNENGVIMNPSDKVIDPFKEKLNEKINNNEKIIPMGSNYDIMKPSVGVKIQENKKSKGGNMEFSKFFNKTSLEDYDKILNEFVPLQNQSMLKTSFNDSIKKLEEKEQINNNNSSNDNILDNSNTKINNNNNLVSNNNLMSNPLLNSSNNNYNTLNSEREFSPNKNYTYSIGNNLNISNPLLSSNNPFLNYSKNNLTLNLDDTIKMNKKKILSTSLKLEFDSMRNLTEVDEYESKSINNSNLFRQSLFNLSKRNLDMTQINNFNTNIIKTKNWGSQRSNYQGDNNEGQSKRQRKPKRNEFLRELGSSIIDGIRTKMPRQRNFKINI